MPTIDPLRVGRAVMLAMLASVLAIGITPRAAIAGRTARRTVSAGAERAPAGRLLAAHPRWSSGSDVAAMNAGANAGARRIEARDGGPPAPAAGSSVELRIAAGQRAPVATLDDRVPAAGCGRAAAIRAPPLA